MHAAHIEAHFMMVFLRHSETEKPKRENERERCGPCTYISYISIHSVHYDCSRTSAVGVGMQSLRVRACMRKCSCERLYFAIAWACAYKMYGHSVPKPLIENVKDSNSIVA